MDEHGNFVNPHRIITLLTSHLAEDKGLTGRVVSTITASAMLARQCKRLGLELTSTPVGFKWIYAEMEKGDVMLVLEALRERGRMKANAPHLVKDQAS